MTAECCCGRFRVVDLARKVVGVGSVGTRDWVLLLLGRDDDDPLLLQFKEAEPSVLERSPRTERTRQPRPTRRRGPAPDAGGQRRAARLAAHRRPRRHRPRLLRPPAVGQQGRRRSGQSCPPTASVCTAPSVPGRWPAPTPAPGTRSPSTPTSAPPTGSTKRWSTMPSAMPPRTPTTTPTCYTALGTRGHDIIRFLHDAAGRADCWLAAMDLANDADYILGHDDVERRRLNTQASFMEPLTRRALVAAGLQPGMRVLDVGAGFGDVTLLAASLVGPTGSVVGIERDQSAVAAATARAAAAGMTNVGFIAGDIRSDVPDDHVRCGDRAGSCSMYLNDPVEALEAAVAAVRRGGLVAFQEWHAADPFMSMPTVDLWDRTGALLVSTFGTAGTNLTMGLGLRACFEAAGLGQPNLRAERLVGGGDSFGGYGFLADIIRSSGAGHRTHRTGQRRRARPRHSRTAAA